MSLGRIAIFAAGAVIGGVIGYASTKSDKVDKAASATIKAGLKAQDWVVDKYQQAKEGVKSAVASSKEAEKSEKPA